MLSRGQLLRLEIAQQSREEVGLGSLQKSIISPQSPSTG